MLTHGITFGGHPVSCAVALKNLEIMERDGIVTGAADREGAFRAQLATLLELDIVGDLRGEGYMWALELVKDKERRSSLAGTESAATRAAAGFTAAESETLLRGFLSPELFNRGLICRADDRGDPVVQISPPLVARRRGVLADRRHPRRRADRGLEAHLVDRGEARRAGLTICDVGPRDGLQNEPDVLEPAVRAELVVAARGNGPGARGGGVVRPRRPRSADGGCRGGRRGGRAPRRHRALRARSERARVRALSSSGPRPGQLHAGRHRDVQPPQRERVARRGGRARTHDRRAGRRARRP